MPKAIQVRLNKILKPEVLALLDCMAGDTTAIAIQDLDGEILYGEVRQISGEKFPIGWKAQVVGWAIAERHADTIAKWLSAMYRSELEKKTITNEALERSKEINCLYHIAEGLISCKGIQDIAQLTVQAAKRVLEFSSASIMVNRDRDRNDLELVAGFGTAGNYTPGTIIDLKNGIAASVIEQRRGEVINNAIADPRFIKGAYPIYSMICVPLFGKERIIGVINISNDLPIRYSASDLKLLKTIASQVTPAIDNLLTYENEMRQAQEREHKLQQQLIELRLEIDEVNRVQQVAEITETEQFRLLLKKAEEHRQRRNRHRELSDQ
ncbi:GAF domain-containing protein [Tumidithrix elongata RA019]|uniref:GAF domain-containing protein n=1 Tax=Tumidithrix elongata BACA0141 TaxID=2716417 RepID=A0AAW9Q1C9_9CYAN|nr:GAF domain-containing protein [Tumidithrix elongata RA019]